MCNIFNNIIVAYVIKKIDIKRFDFISCQIMRLSMKEINKFIFAKIVRDYPAKLEISDPITGDLVSKTQSEIEKCENLCGSEKIETTNDVNEDDTPTVSSNYDHTFDLNHENPSYCNSSMTSECNVFMGDNLEYNDTTIQGEDSKDSEKTIKEEFLVDNRYTNSLSKDFDRADENIRVKYSEEKFVNSGISLNSINVEDNDDKIVDNYIDSRIMTEESVACENIEEEIKNKETRLERNITSCIENPPRDIKELDIENKTELNIESNDYYIDNNKSYLKDAIDLLNCTGENMKHTLNVEEDSIERTMTEIKEMDKIIKNLLYTNDDEQHDSVEERMVKSLSAELESDHEDVMRKIMENCSNVSDTDFQQHLSIRENSTLNFEKSSSEYMIKNFQENKLFSHYRDISDTAIEKEDILKTIKEAEKILTDPYPDMSEASVNENCVRDNLLEKFTKEVNDEECKTINREENNFVENKEMNLENVEIEKVIASNSINSNLQKLAEITCSDRPRSHIEIHETLEKIADEKRKIEDRKKDSLETLSKKFEQIDKFIADRYDISYTSDKDPREFKIPEDFANDSDNLDDFQDDRENVEIPLTKAEIIENLKIEELEKELANEMEEHKKLMDEYQKIIAADLEEIQQATLESEAKQIYNDEKTDEETANQSKNDENKSDELNQMSVMMSDTTTIKIDSESDDSFSEDLKKPERTYIKGKVYDFDGKKHGIR